MLVNFPGDLMEGRLRKFSFHVIILIQGVNTLKQVCKMILVSTIT